MMPGAPVFGTSATSGALRPPVQPISGLHGFPLFMPPMAPLLGFATPENGTLTSPIVPELEEKVSKLESELKQCKEDRGKLRIQVTALKKVKIDMPVYHNKDAMS